MKRFFRFLMAAAIIFSVASCAKEDVSSSLAGGEVEVTFTADLGQLGTRAYGEAENVNRVYLAVYEKDATTPLTALTNLQEGYPVNDCKATIQVVLLKDKVYDLVFWAQNQNVNCYTRNWNGRSISVNYDDVNSQDDVRDAFFLVDNDFKAGHDETTFKLYRPFAQLNAGLNAEDVTNITNNGVDVASFKSQVVVKQVATTLNLLEEATDTATDVADFKDVTFKLAAKPTQTLTTTSGDYNYLSMNYLLVDAKQNVDVEYTFVDGEGTEYLRPYYAVPVQRNYRTNIIGQLISSPLDFNVEILPGFANEEYEVLVKPWDGKTEVVTPVDDVYSVSNANQLAYIAEQVKAGNNLAGQTIKLTNDIDLNNIPWTPIGLNADNNSVSFQGILDGAKATRGDECYTIYNLNVVTEPGYTGAGLFGAIRSGAVVKNLNIVGASVEHTSTGAATVNGIAVVAGSTAYGATIENVTVKNAVVKGNRYTAGIVGYADGVVKNCTVEDTQITLFFDNLTGSYDNADKGGSIVGYANSNFEELSGCVAKNVTITGYRDLGGIIGYARGNISGNTVENVTIVADNTHNYKGYTKAAEYDFGSIYGEKDSNAVVENNTGNANINLDNIGLSWTEQATVANATVNLPAQAEPYVLPATIADGVTFVGDGENTVVNITKPQYQSIASTTNVFFKNLTVQKDNTNYVGFHGVNTETYIGCTINGALWTYGNAYFEDCTFNQDGDAYNVWIYNAGNVAFKNCEFNCAYKSILIYSESAKKYNVTIDDCTFVSQNDDNKAAVQMHTELGIYGTLKINNSTATGFANINNGLWNEINKSTGNPTNNFEKWVDGVQVYSEWTLNNGVYSVYTANGLNTVLTKLSAADKDGDYTIEFAADLNGTAVVNENNGVNIVIDGKNHKYDGQIKIQGNSNRTSETLLIKNVNFETSTAKQDFIWSADSTNGSAWRYANNITIENCTFTAVEGSAAVNTAVGARFQQAYDIILKDCTGTNLHSLLQAESCGAGVTVDGATVVNCKNGVSLNNTMTAIVKNSNIESVVAGGYGIRHKGEVNGYSLTITDCSVEAFVPVLIRNMTASSYTCTLSGTNTLTETNPDHDWQIVITKGDYDGTAEPTAPTGVCDLNGAEGFVVFGN